ncbi:MAG: hypothetical protein RJB10_2040 [Pseudomonadota bacterium]
MAPLGAIFFCVSFADYGTIVAKALFMRTHLHIPQHPSRVALHNEIHARPPEAMTAPVAISHVVMVCDAGQRQASREHVAALLRDHHLPPPDVTSTHIRVDLGGFRLRWELHTEFVTYTFTRSLEGDTLNEREPQTAIDVVPQDWLEKVPGEALTSMHVWSLPTHVFGTSALIKYVLNEDTLVASSLTPRRLGRLVQRLLEIETYRMAALLGLPAARDAGSKLAGQVESQYASTHSRFSASSAYFALVDDRIEDINESRLAGLQTIREFMDRRLTPARSTCEWATRRQDALSQRVSRISNLLRTRVEIEQQQSSQALLGTMNDRQDLQLKLQSTVEGLSVAAITYYTVGLISYLAKGAQKLGWPLSGEVTAAIAIPFVAFGVWWSLRRLHKKIAGH